MKAPLDGIRVVDLTHWVAGPYACSMLAHLGAEVIKVEQLGVGDPARSIRQVRGIPVLAKDGQSVWIPAFNWSKKGMALDLRKAEAREALYRLVEKSDVVVQNFRLSVAAKLGIDYQTLQQHNAKIVYATVTAYGPKGPDADRAGFAPDLHARGGLMTMIGGEDNPVYAVLGMADETGAMMLVNSVLAALLARDRFGEGQEVNVSILGSVLAAVRADISIGLLLNKALPPFRREDSLNPLFNPYRTKNGDWMFLDVIYEKDWEPACQALGIAELVKDERFETVEKRAENRRELIAILDKVLVTKTLDEWAPILNGHDIMFSRVNKVTDLASDPQIIANEYVQEHDHPTLGKIKLLGMPFSFSKSSVTEWEPGPELGQHTEEVLLEVCGYSMDEVLALKDKQAII